MSSLIEPIPRSLSAPAWDLRWLTPARCRMILIAVLLLDVLGHLHYLRDNCPIDLSGDEAQYWDWSRNLDLSYYSKGPLVAWIIRASTTLFGNTMPAVRYPAIAFGVGTSLLTYAVTRRLFVSERLALGAVLLNHIVPMFIAGSVLMTIDPPMYFCWAMATYFAAIALFDNRNWAWPLVGFAIGVGFLAKYAAMLWFLGVIVFMVIERRRNWRGLLIAFIVALLCMTPVVIWNIRHGGVTVLHVARQTGAAGGSIRHGNLIEHISSQIAVVGPVLAVLMCVAVYYTFSRKSGNDPFRAKLRFLACIGLTFFALTTLISFFTKVQVNWPAPAYFTLMILTAYYLGTRLHARETWRPWRAWFYGAVVIGLITIPIAHDSSRLFPIARLLRINPGNIDLLMRLRGWSLLGDHVTAQLKTLRPDAFVLCDDYQQTAETAFYVEGQPKTYYAGSWYSDAKRFTQYDMWPDRRLDDAKLRGRDAVFVGKGGAIPPDIAQAFDRIESLPELPVIVGGVTVKTFKTWRCYNFKGMTRTAGHGDY